MSVPNKKVTTEAMKFHKATINNSAHDSCP